MYQTIFWFSKIPIFLVWCPYPETISHIHNSRIGHDIAGIVAIKDSFMLFFNFDYTI